MEVTEDLICRSAYQYDIALVHDAHLASCHLQFIGASLKRCAFLVRLDLHQNQLSSLDGVEAIGGTLLFLNVAENKIKNIEALKFCVTLQTLYLEGNQLQDEKAVQPLGELEKLNEVIFQRRVPFEGEKDGYLLLDNPFCLHAMEYKHVVESLLRHVRWVDGAMFRGEIQGGVARSSLINRTTNNNNDNGASRAQAAPSVSYQSLKELLDCSVPSSSMDDPDVKACLSHMSEISADMAVPTDEERRFQISTKIGLHIPTETTTIKS